MPELAPFLAQAAADLSRPPDGLDHDAAVEHLEATVARGRGGLPAGVPFPAARPRPGRETADAIALGDGSVVLVQHARRHDRRASRRPGGGP